jgi:hypothetical protein
LKAKDRVVVPILLPNRHFSFALGSSDDIETPLPGGPMFSWPAAIWKAGMVKLVDTPDLGSGAARRGSSSLSTRTTIAIGLGGTELLIAFESVSGISAASG